MVVGGVVYMEGNLKDMPFGKANFCKRGEVLSLNSCQMAVGYPKSK